MRTDCKFGFVLLIPLLMLASCGGGSGGDSSNGSDTVLLNGTLVEAGGAGHGSAASIFRHSLGASIERVRICAIGRCSITDDSGQWGFFIEQNLSGQPVEFSVDGHGIETTVVVTLPAAMSEILIELSHYEANKVRGSIMAVDGRSDWVPDEHDNLDHHSNEGESHSHT